MEQLSPHWTDFNEIWHLSIFRTYVQKMYVSLISDKNNGYFTFHLWQYFVEFILEWEMSQTNVLETLTTYILCLIILWSKIVYRFGDTVEKYGRSLHATDNIIRRMRFACWIANVTDTHSEYVIFMALPRQQWFLERAPMLRYTYTISLVNSY
jgi:hypothetical protein